MECAYFFIIWNNRFLFDFIFKLLLLNTNSMLPLITLLFAIALSLFSLDANAENEYLFTHMTRENSNLGNNNTRAILQDQSGNIWVGTYAGLSRYDGKNFTNFDRLDFGVESDYISCLAQDRKGDIWIGTDDGVVVYDRLTGTFKIFHQSEIKTRIYSLCPNDNGVMWIGTRGKGLYYYDGMTLKKVPGTEEISSPYRIKSIESEVIIADYCHNIFIYSNGNLKPMSKDFFYNDNVEGLAIRDVPGGQLLYVASKTHGICEVALSTEEVKVLCQVPGGQRPIDVDVAGDKLYISTTGGMMVYDFKTLECKHVSSEISDPFSLSNEYVRFCFQDRDSSLWVGTEGGGLNYCNRSQTAFTKYYMTSEGESLKGSRVRDFAQSPDGNVWVATERAGLLVLDAKGRLLPAQYSESIPKNLTAVCTFGDAVFLGSVDGVLRLNPKTGETYSYPQFVRNGEEIDSRIICLCKDLDGNLYAGCSTGVSRYDRESDTFVEMKNLANIVAEDITQDKRGKLWIASYSQGAFCYDLAEERIVGEYSSQNGKGPVHEMTSSILCDSAGNIWVIGYSSGFFKYDCSQDVFSAFDTNTVPQLPTNLFYGSVEDKKGRLWLSSDSGIIEYLPHNNAVSVYSVKDGLLSNDNTSAAISLDDGTVLFGSIDGFVRFAPDTFPDPEKPVVPEESILKNNLGLVLLIILGSVLVVAAVFLLVYLKARKEDKKRNIIREAERDAELYKEKLDFFSGVIHEIKTPLTLLRTPLQVLLSSGSLTDDQKADISMISDSTDYLDSLVKELLEFIRVEEHGYVLNKKNEDIVDRVRFIVCNFKEAAKSKNIRLELNFDQEEIISAVDGKSFTKIVNNMLDNAIKYGETFVKVNVSERDGKVFVKVENDGPSIPKDRRESIFKPFIRYNAKGHEYSQSFGIGLSLSSDLAQLHDGSLTLSDTVENTEFVLTLPCEKFNESPIEDNADEEMACSSLPLLLVVEDNTELSSYLKRKLQDDYRILRANTAEQAIELLAKYKIDLMMTDIGLPGMNGIELCKYVSSSPSLCYIPIIVVSALSAADVKIKCVENGASAYIEKPFSLDFLQATIKGALDKKKYMKAAFSESSAPSIPSLPDRDQAFIKRFDEIVMANISNSDFTKTQIEEQMFISHSSLSRKVKELLNTTPGDYIRDKRLTIAAKMLSEHKVQISDVCYAVGFSSSSYFAKSFKAKYGKTPMEYMEDAIKMTNNRQ